MKKFIALLLCFVLILIPLSSVCSVADSPAGYALNTGTKTYTVTTADGLLAVIAQINAGRFDYHITLDADIDLTGREYTPIAPTWNSKTAPNDLYTGTFDGNGHTITGMTISDGESNRGLIAFGGDNVTVRNLTLLNPSIICAGYSGFLIGSSRGTNVTVSNVYINHGRITGTANYIGGLIGRYDKASGNVSTLIENCAIDAELSGTQSVGGATGGEGVGGTAEFHATFRNIVVKGIFTASNSASRIGGVIGYSNLVDITFENCVALNKAVGTNDIGGLTGVAYKADFTIRNCYSDKPFSGTLSPNTAHTIAITDSAIINSGNETADFFSIAPTNANAALVTVTVDGEKTPCAGLRIPTVIVDLLRVKIDALFAGNAGFLTIVKSMLADELSHTSALALRAFQESTANSGDTLSIRFIGTIATSYQKFDSLGFEIGYTDPSETVHAAKEVRLKKVFSSILANEAGNIVTHTAAEFGGDFIAALTLHDIPATGACAFTITPISVIGSARIVGTTYIVTFVNGVVANIAQEGNILLPTSGFGVDSIGLYTIVYASEPAGLEPVANSLRDAIQTATGKTLPVVCNTASQESANEILIGPTDRSFSGQCYAESSSIMHYEIKAEGGKLQFVVGGPYSGMKCVEKFLSRAWDSSEKFRSGTTYYATDLATDSEELTSGADIRVMSANVLNYHWGEESHPNLYPVATRCEIFMGVLLRFQPDLVGLQEADENWRDALPYYLNSMAEKERVCYTHLLPNVSHKGKTVVNYSSILYRSDLYSAAGAGCEIYEANYQSSYCQRVGTYAKFTSKTDPAKQAIVVNTQWAHETEARILSCVNEQAALVDRLKTQYPNVPIFCTGDFNSDQTRKPTNETSDPNVRTRDQYFLQFVDQISGTVASEAAKEKGVLITPGGCRFSAANVNENTPRPLDYDFIDHIVVSGGYADVLRHDTIRSNGCHVMSDHSPIYADFSLKYVS